MSADAPVDPNATQGVKDIINAMWANAQSGNIFSGAQITPLDSGVWYHTDNPGFAEWDQYAKTTGFHPKIMSIPLSYYEHNSGYDGTPNTGTTETDIYGVSPLDLSPVYTPLGNHISAGGFGKFMQVPHNPCTFRSSTKSRSGNVTIAQINADTTTFSGVTGVLKLAAIDDYCVYPMQATGGRFTILDTVGNLHYGKYTGIRDSTGAVVSSSATGLGWLTGVVIDGDTSAATTNTASTVSPAILQYGQVNLPTPANTGIWHLQWDANAWQKLNAYKAFGLTGSEYAASKTVNANFNFNRWLDYLAYVCNILNYFGLSVILRLCPEPNTSAWWYSAGKSTWFAAMWKYMVGYLTGNQSLGFATQPVAGSTGIGAAVHNAVFLFAQSASSSLGGMSCPDGSLVDLIGLEWYNSNPTAMPGDTTTLSSYAGYSNKPFGITEWYTNIVNVSPSRGVCAGVQNLQSLPALILHDDWYEVVSGISNPFPTTGFPYYVMVPTNHGIKQVRVTGASRVNANATEGGTTVGTTTLTIDTVVGGAVSDLATIQGAMCTQLDTNAGDPATAWAKLKTCVAGTGAPKPAYFLTWDGSSGSPNCELYIPGYNIWQTDSNVINKELSTPSNWKSWGWKTTTER